MDPVELLRTAAAPGTPIAQAVSTTNYSMGAKDEYDWQKLLTLSATGIDIQTSTHATGIRWAHGKQPSSMANSTADPRTFGALAMTNIGKAFAIVSTGDHKRTIESWQLGDDFESWTSTGSVDIGSAWD